MEIQQMLALAKQTAKDLGFDIRQDLLDGNRGGMCEFGGKRWIILDVGQNSLEQLHAIGNALKFLESLDSEQIPVVLRDIWKPYLSSQA
ncbi:MAG: hypothetical protein VX776_08170 [Planctomycetota bacterium]|nr:hypothetical protein [Planctomycetota bacterium]